MDGTEPTRESVAKLEAENAELKQRIQQLVKREQHLRAILDTEPECVKSLAPDGTLLEMNRAGLEMIEAESLEQVLGQCLYSLVTSECRPAFQALIERVFRGESGTLEFAIVGLKGTLRWLESHATPLRDEGGQVTALLSITRDITERKRMEKTLRENQSRLQLLVKSSNVGLWDWNLLNNEVFFSAEWKSQLGYTDDEVPNCFEEWERRVHPDDLQRTLGAVSDFHEGRSNDYDVEFRLRHRDGSWRWIMTRADLIRDADGRPIRMMGCHVDITERKLAPIALRESETRLRLLFDFSPDALFIVDPAGRFLDANQTAVTRYGYSSDELLRLTVRDLAASDLKDQTAPRVREALGHNLHFEWRHQRKDGSEFPVEIATQPLTLNGQLAILSSVRDITERKRAVDELAESRERLETLSRQLIATQETERRHLARELHDEIGQALTGIKLNLNALQQPSLSMESTSLIHNSIDVVDHTLQQVRNLALDLRPSMLDDIGLVAALTWCLDRQSQRGGFAPHFVVDPSVRGASQEIETACFRIAQESLTNIARHANARNARVELRQLESELELFIQDDGIGFDVPAARLRATQGASIGLLGMSERTQLLGGHFEIESIPSQGTTIHARIPLKTEST